MAGCRDESLADRSGSESIGDDRAEAASPVTRRRHPESLLGALIDPAGTAIARIIEGCCHWIAVSQAGLKTLMAPGFSIFPGRNTRRLFKTPLHMIGAEPDRLTKIGQRGRAAVTGVDQIAYLAYPCVIFFCIF